LSLQERLSFKNVRRIKSGNRISRSFKSKHVTAAVKKGGCFQSPVEEETGDVTVRLQRQHLLILLN